MDLASMDTEEVNAKKLRAFIRKYCMMVMKDVLSIESFSEMKKM